MRISEVYFPETIAETLELLRANPELQLVAGGTEIVGSQPTRSIALERQVASIVKIKELRKTVRTEQFLELGSCTTLTGLRTLASGTLPEPLYDVIGGIANHGVRNIATLGGNLCCKNRFMDLWPVLACLDAQIELRSAAGARWAGLSHLCGEDGSPSFPPATLMARIRIPLFSYNFIFVRSLGGNALPGPHTATFACMANLGRDKIEDFRLIFAGTKAFRLKEHEMAVDGRRRGMKGREMQSLVDYYTDAFSSQSWYDQRLFASLAQEAFERLCS
ncbi:FAD binding domain-containing protein [bacterium]|nr:FAD binding domain-containing protein [bacterium]